MALHEYRRKRQFNQTPEPGHAGRREGRASFVVQLHHASRRHYDFRLEIDGVLKSWACPKGPSYDPSVKRLAVEVEDHPVAYASFQGDIPSGYGKGHVDIFDQGTFSTSSDPHRQLEKGHLEFELFGRRLHGAWHLVRAHRKERKPAWFLIKAKDRFASKREADDLLDNTMRASTRRAAGKSGGAREVAEKLRGARRERAAGAARGVRIDPSRLDGAKKAPVRQVFFKPELARLRQEPPSGDTWLHEVKWDGYRILACIDHGDVTLWSRNGLPWTDKLPDIQYALGSLGLESARLDGELVALHGGHSDFNALQQTLAGELTAPLTYVMFDVPYLQGCDLARVPLIERKALLEKLLRTRASPHLHYSEHVVGHGEEAFRFASEQGLEGIVSKRVNSPYRAGRGDDWIKVKRLASDEFAIVGYTEAAGSRQGFGSLLLAAPQADGWRYMGRVGTGFSTAQLLDLRKKLEKLPRSKLSLINGEEVPRGAHWVKPKYVAEVFYRGIGNQGLLRQASFKALRTDKAIPDLRDSDPNVMKPKTASTPQARGKKAASRAITITHPDRVVYPEQGYTKQDVVDYYRKVMSWFLSGVADRPVSAVRFPDGIDGPAFFQKHLPAGNLQSVGVVDIEDKQGKPEPYFYIDSATSVLELVQYNTLEFHAWGSKLQALDKADCIVFDLDPGPGVAWADVIKGARLVRERLRELGLESFVRTTGGKGLHVVLPLRPACAWDIVREFAHAVAAALADSHPLQFTAVMSKARRANKIFIDYLRNGKGATAVASYSLRGRPGAPVAVPLRWEELSKIKSGAQFDLKTLPARLRRLRGDPWAGIDTLKQDLRPIMKQLR